MSKGLKSPTVRKFEATRFAVTDNFTMKVDPTGTVAFTFDDSSVEVGDVKGVTCRVGAMDKIYLTSPANAYDPAVEAEMAMKKGFSEVAAITMAFLRGLLVTSKRLKVGKEAVVVIEKLTGVVEIRATTAETLLKSADFWYSAASWITRYATERANRQFSTASSTGELMLPWLMRLYSSDAHLGVVVANFIEANLFAPFCKRHLTGVYARNLGSKETFFVSFVYQEILPSNLVRGATNLLLAYNALNTLVRRTKLTVFISEAAVVMRQLLFALEILLSSALDKVAIFDDAQKVLNMKGIDELMPEIVKLNMLLKISPDKKAKEMRILLTFGHSVNDFMPNDKKMIAEYKAAAFGSSVEWIQKLLSALASVVTASIV